MLRLSYRLVAILLLLSTPVSSYAQNILDDSLRTRIENAERIQDKVLILKKYMRAHQDEQDPVFLENYGKLGYRLAEEAGDTASLLFFNSQWARAEHFRSNYSAALGRFLQGLRVAEAKKDSELICFYYNYIGGIHREAGNNEKGLHYYQDALDISKAREDSVGIAMGHNNVGIALMVLGRHEEGMKEWERSLNMKLAMDDSLGASSTMGNMAKHYLHLGEFDKARGLLKNSIRIEKKHGDQRGLATSLISLGDLHLKEGRTGSAIRVFEKTLELVRELESKNMKAETFAKLARAHEQLDEIRKAYRYHKMLKAVQDSIHAEQKEKKLQELEARFQNEKKQLRIQRQNARIEAQDKEVARQNIQKTAFAVGFSLALLSAALIARNYLQKKKDNRIISSQKEKVEEQKELLEEKNEEILDSIHYAERLQRGILPSEQRVREELNDAFVLYMPKDVVAGDFYWIQQAGDRILFAAADCTGHGVPGAMVSVVCNKALEQCVKEYGIVEPAPLLDQVNRIVGESFKESEEEVKDGMDIALCSYSPKKGELLFAGANNPLYLVRPSSEEEQKNEEGSKEKLVKGEWALEEIKADKQAIGGQQKKASFTQHRIPLDKEHTIYLFSDGFADQFGGEKGKKYKYKPFKKLLLEMQGLPLAEQKAMLEKELRDWMGNLEQVDDVCVLGWKHSTSSA